MTELNDNERRAFGEFPRPEPPTELENRTVQALRARGLIGTKARPSRRPRIRWLSAAVAAGFAIGFLLHTFLEKPIMSDTEPTGPLFLLLLHHSTPPGETTSHSHVQEYLAWAQDNDRSVVGGEKLDARTGRVLKRVGSQTESTSWPPATMADYVAGYFVVTAADFEEAEALARTCPHLKYGGWIELRPIESH